MKLFTQKWKFPSILFAMIMATMIVMPIAYAFPGHGYEGSHGDGRGMAKHGSSGKKMPPHGMVFKKAKFILMNAEALKITDDQRKAVKTIKIDAKKNLIRQNAEIEIISIDVRSMMHEDKVDTKKIHALLDKKFEIKKNLAKSMIDSFVKLNNVLSKEQRDNLRNLYYASKKKGAWKKV